MSCNEERDNLNAAERKLTFQYRNVHFPFYIDKSKLESGVLEDFAWHRSDVVVVGFPKSGTTWLLNALQHMQEFGLVRMKDNTEALFLEWLLSNPTALPGLTGMVAAQLQSGQLQVNSPRLIRSHLPRHLFPWKQASEKECKIIHITRNPKDVCVSLYYHMLKWYHNNGHKLQWDVFVDDFINGQTFDGPWLQNVTSWKEAGVEENVLHLTYEDLQMDFRKEIQRVAAFLEISLSGGDLDRIERACTVEEMRKSIHKNLILDKAIFSGESSEFVRKAVVGDWRNHFSVAQNERFDTEIVMELEEQGICMTY